MTLRRYLTLLIWLCVLPLALLAAGLAVGHLKDVQDEAQNEARRLSRSLATAVDQLLQARLSALRGLAQSPLADDPARWSELHREARGFSEGFGSHIGMIDAQLRPRLHTSVPYDSVLPPSPPLAVERAARAALDTAQPVVSDLYRGTVSGQDSAAIVVPGMRDGRAAFVFVNPVTLGQLERLIDPLALQPGWGVTLADGAGNVLAQRAAAGDAAVPAGPGNWRFVELATLAPWSVVVQVSQTAFLSRLTPVAVWMLAAFLGATVLAVVGGQLAGRRLARAVRSLVDPGVAPVAADQIEEIGQARALLDDSRTRLEQAAHELAMREAQLRGIVDSASEAIITADESQTIVMANAAAARTFGRPAQALVGAALDSLLPEHLRDRHRADVAAFGASKGGPRAMGRDANVVGLRADGVQFPVEAAISQALVDGRRLYTVILRDVTARRAAEAALQASKAELEAALSSMSEAVLIVDQRNEVIRFNEAFARFHRFEGRAAFPATRAEFDRLVQLLAADGSPLPRAQWLSERALRGEAGTNVEVSLRRIDSGEQWTGSFSFAPIHDGHDAIVGAVLVGRDISELKRMHSELAASHASLQRLIDAQNRIEDAQRRRIALELHDGLQQTLAAIKMNVSAIDAELTRDAARIAPLTALVDELATSAIVSLRRIVNDLRPLLLEDLGLVAALEVLCKQFEQRSGVAVQMRTEGLPSDDDAVPPDPADCLYRVAQEALNNVAKHAGAQRVQVVLSAQGPGCFRLSIRDDGRGLSDGDRRKPHSFGLRGMAERARSLGGWLHVQGHPGGGTWVEVEVQARPVDVHAVP